MDFSARRISKLTNDRLFDFYSRGAMKSHTFTTEDGKLMNYRSTGDVEAILGPVNSIQDRDRLNEYLAQYKDKKYDTQMGEVTVQDFKFSYPHKSQQHDVPPPHPTMSEEEIMMYIWPNADLNRKVNSATSSGSYVGSLWIDIGSDSKSFRRVESSDDDVYEAETSNLSKWEKLLDWPIMVGSNMCNLAILRSYLDSENFLPEYHQTEGERARYLLDNVIKYEPSIPDGYFIIGGKMKKVSTVDRIQMNMIYVIKDDRKIPSPSLTPAPSSKISAVDNRLCEVRSVRKDLGLVYHQMYYVISEEKISSNLDRDTFKIYNSYAVLHPKKGFQNPFNIFDIARMLGYVAGVEDKEAMDTLLDRISEIAQNDSEIMRPAHIGYGEAQTRDIEDLLEGVQSHIFSETENKSEDEKTELLIKRINEYILPHCFDKDPETMFQSKIWFLAMMFVELTSTIIPDTILGPRQDTDRKDFQYKRWESVGYLMREYLRNVFYYITDLQQARAGTSNLITLLNQNKWPKRYTKGISSKNKASYVDGIVDDVVKYNPISMLDSIKTVKINTKAGANTGPTRRIHTSQWGAQCFANTPENSNIGLLNNMAEAVLISDILGDSEYETLLEYIESAQESDLDENVPLFLDGAYKKHVSLEFASELRNLRSKGIISREISITDRPLWVATGEDGKQINGPYMIYILTSHGRPLIPMFKINKSQEQMNALLSIDPQDIDSFEQMLEEGYVEFVDSYEMAWNVTVAPWFYIRGLSGQMELINPEMYTHSMIMPGHILSATTNCLSFVEHNPAARGTYATVHIKSSIGQPFKYMNDRYDHEINYLNHVEPPILMTETSRRLGVGSEYNKGYGNNVTIACMSMDNNKDDAIIFSEKMVQSGKYDGFHFNIFSTDHVVNMQNMYNWQIDELPDGTLQEKKGFIDPMFSDSVRLPYGDPHLIDVPQSEFLDPSWQQEHRRKTKKGVVYDMGGRLYIRHGSYRKMTVQYTDGSEREVIPGKNPIDIPGKTRDPNIYTPINGKPTSIGIIKGERVYQLALAFVPAEDDLSDLGRGWQDTPFMEPVDRGFYKGPVRTVIPRTILGNSEHVNGQLITIRPRASIKRNEVAIKILERDSDAMGGKIKSIQKERFDITYGYITGITRGAGGIKIRGAMPIGPKPGNKYAALYAQKNVCANVLPMDKVPRARWYNNVLNIEEEIIPDIIFNSLSFPSRMTMGMELEIFIAGTLSYLFSQEYMGKTYKEIFDSDPKEFDRVMKGRYATRDAYQLISELQDSTCFIYDNELKVQKCKQLREELGLPIDARFDMYIGDSKVQSKIYVGTVYYVALRHLVDNKSRSRGYVGKRNPITLQPVKGRRRNGGANTGTMEADAYKAHGSVSLLHERLARVSDYEVFNRCSQCSGYVSKKQDSTYNCMRCGTTLQPTQVYQQEGVFSWLLWNTYLNALGVQLTEEFK